MSEIVKRACIAFSRNQRQMQLTLDSRRSIIAGCRQLSVYTDLRKCNKQEFQLLQKIVKFP